MLLHWHRDKPIEVLYIVHRCSMCPSTFADTADIYAIIHYAPLRVSISRLTRATVVVIRLRIFPRLAGNGGNKDCILHKTSRRKRYTELHLGTGMATALTRQRLVLCVLSTFVAKFDWHTLTRLCGSEPDSSLVERGNYYYVHSTGESASFPTCQSKSSSMDSGKKIGP
jgi:hypothetical protein